MGYDNDGRGWGMGDSMGWFGWLMMSSVFLLCAVLVVVLIWAVLRGTSTPGSVGTAAGRPGPRPAAQETLDERFARGEIDLPEYEQRTRALYSG